MALLTSTLSRETTRNAYKGAWRVATLTGDETLTNRSEQRQRLDPGGASRTLTLPAVTKDDDGYWFELVNAADADEDLVIEDADASSVVTIGRGASAVVFVTAAIAWALQSEALHGAVLGGVPLAGVPTLISKQITTTELTDAAASQSIVFDDAIPAKAVVLGSWFDLDTVFAGGSAATAVIDVGDGVDPDGYVDAEDVFTGATTGQRSTPANAPGLLVSNTVDVANAARTPAVLITITADTVDNLTTGDVTAYVLYVATPAGAVVS